MERTLILIAIAPIGKTITNRHIGRAIHKRSKKTRSILGRIRVIAIHHEVIVSFYIAEHLTNYIAFTLARLTAYNSAAFGSNFSSIVVGIIVVYIDVGARK